MLLFFLSGAAMSSAYAAGCADIKKGKGRVASCKIGSESSGRFCQYIKKGDGRLVACAIGAGKASCSNQKQKVL